jgi:hypothetical protein
MLCALCVRVGALRLRGGGCCGSKPDSAPRNSGPRDTSGVTILTLDAHGPAEERATREASVSAASEEAPERNASDEAAAAFQWSLEAGGACDLPEDQLTAIAEEAAVARKSDKVDIDEGPWKEYDGKGLELLLLEDAALGGEAPVRLVDARFLIALALAGGRLLRRQDLPRAASLDLSSLRKMARGREGLRVLCVSYPWLQPECVRAERRSAASYLHPTPAAPTLSADA